MTVFRLLNRFPSFEAEGAGIGHAFGHAANRQLPEIIQAVAGLV